MSDEDHVAAARAVYDLAAPRYVRFVGTEISPATEGPIERSLLLAFVELIKRQMVARVADVGCGPGRVAAFLAARGLDVVGVDVSEAMLAVARTAHPHITFEQGQLDALPIETGVLAGAVYWYSITYTPPDRLTEVFTELTRVLMPGAMYFLPFRRKVNRYTERMRRAHSCRSPARAQRAGARRLPGGLRIKIDATVLRAPDLQGETTPQAFVIARRPLL